MKYSDIFKGQTLIELLLAISLTAIFLPVLVNSLTTPREGRVQDSHRTEATLLEKEAFEAVRSVRERDWNEVSINGTYHPQIQGSRWILSAGAETTGDYTREVIISDTLRDGNGNIVASGGTADPSTKKVVIRISWTNPRQSELTSTLYLSRFTNEIYEETTKAQFDSGSLSDVEVLNTAGGEIGLGTGGHGDWCRPNDFIVAQLNLPHTGDARDVKAIQGKAFTGTHSGGSGSFVEIDISNASPPVASIANIIQGYETNDIFIDQNYAYIATGDIGKDVVIIDLNTNQEVGFFNDSYLFGTAQGIWVKDNVGYVTIGFRLHTFNLSQKTGERPEMDSVSLGFLATGYRLQVVGNYAYVAVDFGQSELRLVNVTNPSNISTAGQADVNGAAGREVYVNAAGTRAYLATANSGSQREMFIINTTTKTGNLPILGSYDSSGMSPTGITVVEDGTRAILVGTGGEEYQVIDVTNPATPTRCGGVQVNSGIYGVDSVKETDNDAYSYIVTGDGTNEFKIIEGGPGGQYLESGVFTSQIFDPGKDVTFNRLFTNVTLPAQTNIQFQVGIAQPVNNSCSGASFAYVGPDGTSSSYFTSNGGAVPLAPSGVGYRNPGRCFRYRAYLTTNNFAVTPLLNSVGINYSP